ncbi:hypothetical protein DFJ58DRAFT_171837 [Suillus subalutaceus]|uniref:uncharacterized protein n=1 Tax=Suillus subalutaceus TaxID=48586 RepID=UPI001B87F7F8|nr:uncharacterized protein DFJ58DRAFT_171837 [Suillus subalutaceus]KAG1836388.1 hypothetical protein DFJ58DRAFT_171837 [Suillus subalutaceus]
MRLLLVLLCVFLYLFGVIQASPTTNTTNTTTSDSFKAPTFATRTIWSIISSSVLTLFACIYSAIHPNIPSPKDSPLLILRRRLGIMIMALIAPELIVTWAMRQWISACRVTRQFKESGFFKVSQQSENHRSIAATAEQYVEDHDRTRLLLAHPEAPTPETRALAKPFKKLFKAYVSEQSEDYTWTQTHSFFVLMGGFMLYVDGKPYHTLQPDEVLKLIRAGCIDAPTLTANRIHDKSKGNAISKGLVMLQVAWFIMQLITRAIYHLETTQLEVGTLAFAVLNFLTYAVWWNKPLDVQCPYPVYWKSTESWPEDHIDFSEIDEFTWFEILFRVILVPIVELLGVPSLLPSRKLRVPTFDGSIELEDSATMVLKLAGLLMATIFGGIHCMAWFFAFPTYQEQVLWRISAVAITCTPSFVFLTISIVEVLNPSNAVAIPILALYALLYITARSVLLVLMFATLHNLSPNAYKAVLWTSLVPHL